MPRAKKEIIPLTDEQSELFWKLYEVHHRSILQFVKTLPSVINVSDAEDITHDAFIKGYKGFPEFGERSQFKTWMCRIAINVWKDKTRRKTHLNASSLEDMIEGKSFDIPDLRQSPGERLFVGGHFVADVDKAINSLSPLLRKAIKDKYYIGMSEPEIAKADDISKPAIKNRIFQGRRNMRSQLESRPPRF